MSVFKKKTKLNLLLLFSIVNITLIFVYFASSVGALKLEIAASNYAASAQYADVMNAVMNVNCGYIGEWGILIYNAPNDAVLIREKSTVSVSGAASGNFGGDRIRYGYISNSLCTSIRDSSYSNCYEKVAVVSTDEGFRLQPGDSSCTVSFHLEFSRPSLATTTTTIVTITEPTLPLGQCVLRCGEWSACSNNLQVRTCLDGCGVTYIENQICQEAKLSCAQDVYRCPDGTFVFRNPSNNCQYDSCPIITPTTVTPSYATPSYTTTTTLAQNQSMQNTLLIAIIAIFAIMGVIFFI